MVSHFERSDVSERNRNEEEEPGVEVRTGCWSASAAVGLLFGSGSSSFLMKSFAVRDRHNRQT